MPTTIVYYAHPGHRHSTVNAAMQSGLNSITDLTRVDLYQEYPRHKINIEAEQNRLLAHDIIVFQFPFFWYSTPSIVKEWQDLVLEYGFAYGPGGDKLAGKTILTAITAGGSELDYSASGRHHSDIRTLLKPLESTARLCQMHFAAPYVLFSALSKDNVSEKQFHVDGFVKLVSALQSGKLSINNTMTSDTLSWRDLEHLMEPE